MKREWWYVPAMLGIFAAFVVFAVVVVRCHG